MTWSNRNSGSRSQYNCRFLSAVTRFLTPRRSAIFAYQPAGLAARSRRKAVSKHWQAGPQTRQAIGHRACGMEVVRIDSRPKAGVRALVSQWVSPALGLESILTT